MLKSKCLLPLLETQWSHLASRALRRGHLHMALRAIRCRQTHHGSRLQEASLPPQIELMEKREHPSGLSSEGCVPLQRGRYESVDMIEKACESL